MTIETSQQWWQTIEHDWDELVTLFRGCRLEAELAPMERMLRVRDASITRRLLTARKQAPDRRTRRGHRGWQLLFDLCAEQWVLYATA
jgi:hypothetical protein